MPDKGPLKERIRKGEVVIGVSVTPATDRRRMEELLTQGSYDFFNVDSQHRAYDEERLATLCDTAAELNMPVQLRIRHSRNAYLIGSTLDLGFSGIEVPQVETEAVVQEAVDYFYYPQRGKRSWGGVHARLGFTSGNGGVNTRLDYADYWNSYGVLMMQIESINAISNAGKLAKPGVDCLSWGSNDLAFSLEAYPQHPLKTDDDCVRHVLEQLKGTNVRVAIRSGGPANRDKYLHMGVTVLLETAQS